MATSAMVFGGLFLVSPAAAEDNAPDAPSEPSVTTATQPVDEAAVANTATITINKGGARSAGAVDALDGAVFTATPKSGTGAVGGSCTTGLPTAGSGSCTILVTFTSSTATFEVSETAAPEGYSSLGEFWTGDLNGQVNTSAKPYLPVTVQVSNGGQVVLPTDGQGRGPLANRADNPAWSKFCGMDIALLFDRSGSIDEGEWGQMVTAAAGFATALGGTPSTISVFGFADKAQPEFAVAAMDLSNGSEAAVSTIEALSWNRRGGATNWDEGLWQIVGSGQTLDAVMMLTDGDPTVNRLTGDSGGTVNVDDITEAVFSANAVKAMGADASENPRLVGIGIGMTDGPEDMSRLNLEAITGPNLEGQDPNYYETSFGALDTLLTEIARDQCQGTITVNKYVTTTNEGPGELATDRWPFTATVLDGGGNAPTSTPADGQTGDSGDSQGRIQFTLTGGQWPKNVKVEETVLEGSELLSATCTITRTGNEVVTEDTSATFELAVDEGTGESLNYVQITGMAKDDNVTCEFLNKVATPPCVDCGPTPTPTPTPTTPPKTPTPTVVEAPAVAAPAEMVEAVAVAQPATVPEAEAPAEVSVPAAATVPESVPAGDGSQGPAVPVWITALLMASLLGVAAAWAMRLGGRKG